MALGGDSQGGVNLSDSVVRTNLQWARHDIKLGEWRCVSHDIINL
jgi:hypothetical protein